MRSDDLAPDIVRGLAGPDLGFRQGLVVTWDPIAKTNTIDVGGSVLTDVPLIVTSSVTVKAGDVVGLLRVRSQYFVLGKILPPHTVDTVAVPGVYGLGLGALNQWPQTSSTSEVAMIVAQLQPHGTVLGWQAYTSVQASTTARYRAYINGIQVADSGTYSAGSGHFDGLVTWPAGVDTTTGATFELRAQVLSGSGFAAISMIQLYEE